MKRKKRAKRRARARAELVDHEARRKMLRQTVEKGTHLLDQVEPHELAVLSKPIAGFVLVQRVPLDAQTIEELIAASPDPLSRKILETRSRGSIKVALLGELGVTYALVERGAEVLVNAPGGAA